MTSLSCSDSWPAAVSQPTVQRQTDLASLRIPNRAERRTSPRYRSNLCPPIENQLQITRLNEYQ